MRGLVYAIPHGGLCVGDYITEAGFKPGKEGEIRNMEEARRFLDEINSNIKNVSGLCVVGGMDVNPSVYNKNRNGTSCCHSPEFDLASLHVIKYSPVPVFGFCRGFQLAHVALSNKSNKLHSPLDQHLQEHLTECGGYHRIQFVKDVRWMGIENNTVYGVNSIHHQGLYKEHGEQYPDMEILAYSVSKHPIVEAAQWRNYEGVPVVGVQFHPEMMKRDIDLAWIQKLFVDKNKKKVA